MNAQADHFNIRWNNYTTVLQSVFRKLLDGEQFVDVTLACEGKSIKCHRVVLSACSVYFEKLLTDNSYPHLVIYIKDMKYWELQALVTFMYNGEVSVNQNKLASLVKAAESLKIKGLAPDSSFQDDISEKIDEDDIEEYHIGTKHGNESNSKEEKQSLLRYRSPPKQLKRKVMTAPPKLVKMQKIERQTNGGFGINMKQESHPPSDDDESFPHETAESSEVGVKDEEAEDDMESLEVSLNPVDEGSGDGHSSPSDVEESQTPNAGGIRSRFAYKYGKEIRDSALAALSSGMSLRQCSEAFGIPRKTLSKWKNRAPSVTPEENVSKAYNVISADHEKNLPMPTSMTLIPAVKTLGAGVVGNGGGSSSMSDSDSKGIVLPPGVHPKKIRVIRKHRVEILSQAAMCILKGMTFQHVSEVYDVPKTTLRDYMVRKNLLLRGPPKKNLSANVDVDNGTTTDSFEPD